MATLDVCAMPLLPLPSFAAQPSMVRSMTARSEQLTRALAAFRSEDVLAFVQQQATIQELRHELSDRVQPAFAAPRETQRTAEELPVFVRLLDHQAQAGDRIVNVEMLIAAATADLSPSVGVRTYRSQSVPAEGYVTHFPDPGAITSRLAALQAWLIDQEALGTPRPFQAIVAMATFAALHPLTDGNGRVSRILFNLIIAKSRLDRYCYLPLHELSARSAFGFIISLKLAQYGNEWQSLCEFHFRSLVVLTEGLAERWQSRRPRVVLEEMGNA